MLASAIHPVDSGFVFEVVDNGGKPHHYQFAGNPLTREGRVVALPPHTIESGAPGSTRELAESLGWKYRGKRTYWDEDVEQYLECLIFWRSKGWSTFRKGRDIVHTDGSRIVDVKWCVQRHAYFVVVPVSRRRSVAGATRTGIASPMLIPRQCRFSHPEELCTVFDGLTEAQQVEVIRAKDLNRLIHRDMRWGLAMLGIGTVDGRICQPVRDYLDAILENEQEFLHA